jgi:phenylpropionate dioxygenase-like ring-hydroxylating dioxygenase large terminal subunit
MKTDLQASHGAAALWHPVVLAADLQSKPYAAHLLGQDVVVWRDLKGQAHAWADQCPHRGARLSLGRVCEGRLECPYHGWQFEGSGRCVRVPALPGFTPPAGHSAQVFEVQECYGLVWVRLNTRPKDVSSAAFALPAFGAETDTRLRKINCGPYDVATSAPRIVENFLDMSHFSFVHAGWLGDRDSPSIEDYQVELTATGLLATGCKAWQPQSNLHSLNLRWWSTATK